MWMTTPLASSESATPPAMTGERRKESSVAAVDDGSWRTRSVAGCLSLLPHNPVCHAPSFQRRPVFLSMIHGLDDLDGLGSLSPQDCRHLGRPRVHVKWRLQEEKEESRGASSSFSSRAQSSLLTAHLYGFWSERAGAARRSLTLVVSRDLSKPIGTFGCGQCH